MKEDKQYFFSLPEMAFFHIGENRGFSPALDNFQASAHKSHKLPLLSDQIFNRKIRLVSCLEENYQCLKNTSLSEMPMFFLKREWYDKTPPVYVQENLVPSSGLL